MAPTRRGSTTGRGRARTLNRGPGPSDTSMPQLPTFIGVPYTPSIGLSYPSMDIPGNNHGNSAQLPDPEEVNTDERLRAAATMIQVTGTESDILGQHQQRRVGGFNIPSQDRLRAFAESIYPQSRPSSVSASFCHTSQATGTGHYEQMSNAPAGAAQSRKATKVNLSSYDEKTQKVVRLARSAAVNDMLLEVGWLYGQASHNARKANFKENLYMACEKEGHDVELDKNITYLIGKGLTAVRTKAVQFAEPYAREYLQCTDPQISANPAALNAWRKEHVRLITDERNLKDFFLHEHDSEGNVSRFFANPTFKVFHLTFWYTQSVSPMARFKATYRTTPTPMLALSAAALLCALDRESDGRQSNRGDALMFEGTVYGPRFDCYREGMANVLGHNTFGQEFSQYLYSLHVQGLQMLEANAGGPGSPRKRPSLFIPEGTEGTTAALPAPRFISEGMPVTGVSSSAYTVPSYNEPLPSLFSNTSQAQAGPSTQFHGFHDDYDYN